MFSDDWQLNVKAGAEQRDPFRSEPQGTMQSAIRSLLNTVTVQLLIKYLFGCQCLAAVEKHISLGLLK